VDMFPVHMPARPEAQGLCFVMGVERGSLDFAATGARLLATAPPSASGTIGRHAIGMNVPFTISEISPCSHMRGASPPRTPL